jgi:hypothetical protein
VRAWLRLWGDDSRAALWARRITRALTPETCAIIGILRDALVILGIVAVGMYFLSNPDKFDAFLNWTLSRHASGSVA